MAKAKQNQLPDMADAKNEKISGHALNYAEIRDKRIKLNKEEAQAKTILMHEMKEARLDRYEDRKADVLVWIEDKENVKVAKPSEEDESDE